MKYEEPIIEVLKLKKEDIIRTSDELEIDDGYTGEGGFAPGT